MDLIPDPVHKPLELQNASLKAARDMRIAMRMSLSIGFLMLIMKLYAYYITHSAAILSDAAESVVHVFAVSFAAYSLWLSSRPADRTHLYGHDRISFFSAGFEGAMIMMAAVYIIYESVMKWIHGLRLEQLEAGTLFVTLATVINGLLGWYLVHQGRKYNSIILVANGKHVLTDSWTSLGVIIGLILIWFTGWLPFDPITAILVASNILWSGGKLIRQSIGGLMDEADPETDSKIQSVLQQETSKLGIYYHDLRHRNAGNKLHIEFHLLFHKDTPIVLAHEQATGIEQALSKAFPMETEVTSHLEPIEGHNEVHMKIIRES